MVSPHRKARWMVAALAVAVLAIAVAAVGLTFFLHWDEVRSWWRPELHLTGSWTLQECSNLQLLEQHSSPVIDIELASPARGELEIRYQHGSTPLQPTANPLRWKIPRDSGQTSRSPGPPLPGGTVSLSQPDRLSITATDGAFLIYRRASEP